MKMKKKNVKFANAEDQKIIEKIVNRATELNPTVDRLSLSMDISATHANGCPLRLADLLAADNFNFLHDVYGIVRHIDRATGKLTGFFLPRFARPKKEVRMKRYIIVAMMSVFMHHAAPGLAVDRWPTPDSEKVGAECVKVGRSDTRLEELKQEWLALEEKTQGGVFFSSTQESNRLHTLRIIMDTTSQLGKKR